MINYNELTKKLFFAPEHAGKLDAPASKTIISRFEAPGAKVSLTLLAEEGLILQARFQAMGEPFLIAGLEWICQNIQHSSLNIHPKTLHSDLISALEIPKTRYSVAFLVESCYFDAINKLKSHK